MGIQNFQVREKLGQGAFATVYKVTRISDGKTYALKKVNIEKMGQKELDDTVNEIRILASFKHPRLVRWYETFLENNDTELCIVMEYCGCGDLSQKVNRYKKRRQYIDERVIWVYIIQLLEGLSALHEKDILHRDLKAANCLLAEDGSIKIGDMNVSKVMKDGALRTQIGTPYYMSPEIWLNRPYNCSSDIWSLGCLVYELCALRPPFLGDSLPSLKTAVLGGSYPPIPGVYSSELSTVIARFLTPNPRERPSARDALVFQEILAKKPLVKNALDEESVPSTELISTIKVPARASGLVHKLPSPAYPETQVPLSPEPQNYSPSNEITTISEEPLSARGRSPSMSGRAGEGSSVVSPASHARRASAVPVIPTEATGPMGHQRRISSPVGQNYERKITVVAEQAHERLKGLMGEKTEESIRTADAAGPEKRSSISSIFGNKGSSPVHRKSASGMDSLERQGSIKKVLQAAQNEVVAESSMVRPSSHQRRISSSIHPSP